MRQFDLNPRNKYFGTIFLFVFLAILTIGIYVANANKQSYSNRSKAAEISSGTDKSYILEPFIIDASNLTVETKPWFQVVSNGTPAPTKSSDSPAVLYLHFQFLYGADPNRSPYIDISNVTLTQPGVATQSFTPSPSHLDSTHDRTDLMGYQCDLWHDHHVNIQATFTYNTGQQKTVYWNEIECLFTDSTAQLLFLDLRQINYTLTNHSTGINIQRINYSDNRINYPDPFTGLIDSTHPHSATTDCDRTVSSPHNTLAVTFNGSTLNIPDTLCGSRPTYEIVPPSPTLCPSCRPPTPTHDPQAIILPIHYASATHPIENQYITILGYGRVGGIGNTAPAGTERIYLNQSHTYEVPCPGRGNYQFHYSLPNSQDSGQVYFTSPQRFIDCGENLPTRDVSDSFYNGQGLTPTIDITIVQCHVGQTCSNCGGDPGHCYPDCNGGWCNGGFCQTCSPAATSTPKPTKTPTPTPTFTPTPTPTIPTYRVAGRVFNIGLSPTPIQCNNVNIGAGVNGRAVILYPTYPPQPSVMVTTAPYQGVDGAFIFDGIQNGSYALCHGTANLGPYACTYPAINPVTGCMNISVQGASQSGIRFIHSSTPTPTPTPIISHAPPGCFATLQLCQSNCPGTCVRQGTLYCCGGLESLSSSPTQSTSTSTTSPSLLDTIINFFKGLF